MGVLDHLKPPTRGRPPGSQPKLGAPVIQDRREGKMPPQPGDFLLERGAPVELLRRYESDGRWKRPKGIRATQASGILRHYTGDGEEILVWMLLLARGQLGAPVRYVYEDGASEIRFDGPPPSLELQ